MASIQQKLKLLPDGSQEHSDKGRLPRSLRLKMRESQIVTSPGQEKELAPKCESTHCFLHQESTDIRKLRAMCTPSTQILVSKYPSPARVVRAPGESGKFWAGVGQEGEEPST